jgi:hypothetical protein
MRRSKNRTPPIRIERSEYKTSQRISFQNSHPTPLIPVLAKLKPLIFHFVGLASQNANVVHQGLDQLWKTVRFSIHGLFALSDEDVGVELDFKLVLPFVTCLLRVLASAG